MYYIILLSLRKVLLKTISRQDEVNQKLRHNRNKPSNSGTADLYFVKILEKRANSFTYC